MGVMEKESMAEFVYFDDKIVGADEAMVSIHDAGLLHGVGLFETMRSYKGRVFRLADHLDRLFESAEVLGIKITQERSDIVAGIYSLLKANGLGEARIRLTTTRGNVRDIRDGEPGRSTLFVTAGPMQVYDGDLYRHGMTVVISPYKQNPDDPTTGHKTVNYLSRLMALQWAHTQGAGEALWFTPTNRLAEGCVSNVFIVQDDKLLTPPLDTPVLAGVSRKVVMEVAEAHDIECEECGLTIKDLLGAAEVLLTNSSMEVMPVRRVEAHVVGEDKPGAMYGKLHGWFREVVESDSDGT